MKKLTWILYLLLVCVLISCPTPGDDQNVGTSGNSEEGGGTGVSEVTGPPGYMVLDCNPTFRTDMVRWGYAKLIDGEWVKQEYNGTWNPELPEKNRYELEPGHYKLINIISDEFVDKGVGNGHGHGAYDLKHDDIEFEVKPGKDVGVSIAFESYNRMPVTFKVKYDGNRVVDRIVVALKVKGGNKICSVSGEYKRQSRVFTNDVESHEVIYVWDGIPLDTAEMRFSVIYTNNTSGAVPWFEFDPGKHSTVIAEASSD